MSEAKDMVKRDAQSVEALKKGPVLAPPVDIYENKDEILLVTDMPGVKIDDTSIHLEKGTLLLEGHRALEEYEVPKGTDFQSVSYRRAFTVPEGIEADGIKAQLSNGVLQIHLPKRPAVKPRQIQVTTG